MENQLIGIVILTVIHVTEELVDLIDIVWLMSLLKLIYVSEGLVDLIGIVWLMLWRICRFNWQFDSV